MSNGNLLATDLHGFSPIKTNQNKIKISTTEGYRGTRGKPDWATTF